MMTLLIIYLISFTIIVSIGIYWVIDGQMDQKRDKLLVLVLTLFAPVTILLLIIFSIKELTE